MLSSAAPTNPESHWEGDRVGRRSPGSSTSAMTESDPMDRDRPGRLRPEPPKPYSTRNETPLRKASRASTVARVTFRISSHEGITTSSPRTARRNASTHSACPFCCDHKRLLFNSLNPKLRTPRKFSITAVRPSECISKAQLRNCVAQSSARNRSDNRAPASRS
jgi:hypothetical protein